MPARSGDGPQARENEARAVSARRAIAPDPAGMETIRTIPASSRNCTCRSRSLNAAHDGADRAPRRCATPRRDRDTIV
jgi:hypothetical protein